MEFGRRRSFKVKLNLNPDFIDCVDFESMHAYDVADLLKLYFRELPECLITDKLMDTFIGIYTCW